MFRTVEVLLLSLSIALQREVFTDKITITRGSRRLLRRFLLFFRNFRIHSGHFRDLEQSQDEIAIARAFCTVINFSHTQSWQRLILIGWFFLSWFVFEFWKAGGSIARQVERSSDRQVALNCHCEGHFVFFLQINKFVWAFQYINKFDFFSLVNGGLPPPLKPPVYCSNLIFFETLNSA